MQAPKFEKFKKLMMMTASQNDGECLNAIRMANAFLAEANLNWDEFLQGKVKITAGSISAGYAGKKYTNATEIEQMLEAVMAGVKAGSSFKRFIESLNDWWEEKGFLTEKQYNALRQSYERI